MALQHRRYAWTALCLAVALTLTGLAPSAAQGADPGVIRSFTSTDGGDGTYTVPLLNSDVPDVSVARVPAAESEAGRDTYYMISTTMHLSPGAPIMRSYDLVNWETVTYVFDRLGMGDNVSLRNGRNSYGEGQWASSLRYHDGKFYAAFNTNNVNGAYIYWTDDIESGAWTRIPLNRSFHDLSLFFDETNGGTPYIFYGGGSTNAVKLSADLKTVVAEYPNIVKASDFPNEPNITTAYEGQQVFHFGGYYYIPTITWPSGGNRTVVLLRSTELLGRYTSVGGVNTYEAKTVLASDGYAQGSLVPVATPSGDVWHGFFFRDTYPLGRIPALIPATWSAGWPTFGDSGSVTYPDEFNHLITLPPALAAAQRLKSVVASDDFANDAPHRAFHDETWQLTAPTLNPALLGVELLGNGDLETGQLAPWQVQYTANLSVRADEATAGGHILGVSGRVNNGSGPGQVLDGKLQAGATYDGSMRVRYDVGPDTMRFIIGLSYGGSIEQVGFATATKGQWTKVTGSFAIPAGTDVSKVKFVVETPWAPNQTAADQVDYVVDDLSLVGRRVTLETPTTAEYAPNGSELDLAWEWNHNPDNRYWSLTERPGWLRLTNGHVVSGKAVYSKAPARELTLLEEARNTLSQRAFGPRSSAEVAMDVSGMVDGDVAGLGLFGRSFGYAGVKRVGGVTTLGLVQRLQPFTDAIDQTAIEAFVPGTEMALGSSSVVHLKADADFASKPGQLSVQFLYSLDGATWKALGTAGPLVMDWSLSHFMGHRIAIFNYATAATGGHVDVDHFWLSNVVSSEGKPLNRSLLDDSLAKASTIDESDVSAAMWTQLKSAELLARAVTTPSTQNQIDGAAYPLAALVAQVAADAEAIAIPTVTTTDTVTATLTPPPVTTTAQVTTTPTTTATVTPPAVTQTTTVSVTVTSTVTPPAVTQTTTVPATVTATATPLPVTTTALVTTTPKATATVTPPAVTQTAVAPATAVATATATVTPATVTVSATPAVTATVTAIVVRPVAPPAINPLYSTPGLHNVNGRLWSTTCEPYSQTVRCRTDIWTSGYVLESGKVIWRQGWAFNNLTYLPMTRAAWGTNPLAHTGQWTAADGRLWRTECDTALTGRNACRTSTLTSVLTSAKSAQGVWTHTVVQKWVLNNIVLFTP